MGVRRNTSNCEDGGGGDTRRFCRPHAHVALTSEVDERLTGLSVSSGTSSLVFT